MIIKTITSGPLQTNSYAIIDSQTRQMVVVDAPPNSAEQMVQIATDHDVQIVGIWLTHSHWDHIHDVAALLALLKQSIELKDARAIDVAIHRLDALNLRYPGSDQIPAPTIEGVIATQLLGDGDRLSVGRFDFRVLHTPGHSMGSIALHCASQGVLFSGDTLFCGAMGTLSLPTARPRFMPASLLKLTALDPQTRVCPGHGLKTTIKGERDWIKRRFDALFD